MSDGFLRRNWAGVLALIVMIAGFVALCTWLVYATINALRNKDARDLAGQECLDREAVLQARLDVALEEALADDECCRDELATDHCETAWRWYEARDAAYGWCVDSLRECHRACSWEAQ